MVESNPAYRYAAVPVQPPGSNQTVVYVVRMQSKPRAIQQVAQAVEDEALVDVGKTRTFDTKGQAKDYAERNGWEVVEYLPYEERVANPTNTKKLKNKLLR